jgi:hypothetical protein
MHAYIWEGLFQISNVILIIKLQNSYHMCVDYDVAPINSCMLQSTTQTVHTVQVSTLHSQWELRGLLVMLWLVGLEFERHYNVPGTMS